MTNAILAQAARPERQGYRVSSRRRSTNASSAGNPPPETELAKILACPRRPDFINVLEVGPARVLEGARDSGFTRRATNQLRIADFRLGWFKVAKAESIYMQAVGRAGESAINAHSEFVGPITPTEPDYDIARHYRDEVIPSTSGFPDETCPLQRHVDWRFRLLAPNARTWIGSVNNYIETRDFWIARG